MNNTLKEWFVFTRKERTGILVLLTIILFITCLPWYFSAYVAEVDKGVTKELQAELSWLCEKMDSVAKGGDEGRYLSHYDLPVEQKLFEFDPNTLSADGWRKLGVRARSVQIIQKYILKGGRFREAGDLKKIYGLRDADRLMPYVRIKQEEGKLHRSESAGERKSYDRSNEYPKSKDRSNSFPGYKKREPRIIDINTADTTALIALPGIGSKLAQRIIRFRDNLGGFHSIEQVKETYGVTDSTFDKIRSLLQCEANVVQKININTADYNRLSQHPYIGRNLANAIVKFRDQHGPYGTLKDLQKIVLITPENFEKIVHYLAVQE